MKMIVFRIDHDNSTPELFMLRIPMQTLESILSETIIVKRV